MTEYSVIFPKKKKIKLNLNHVLLLTYNPHRIQKAYTLWRIAENDFEVKTKLVRYFCKNDWIFSYFVYADRRAA